VQKEIPRTDLKKKTQKKTEKNGILDNVDKTLIAVVYRFSYLDYK
jgi:hypothetical protein